MNIVEFLEARIAEDEAREAGKYRHRTDLMPFGSTVTIGGFDPGYVTIAFQDGYSVNMPAAEFREKYTESAPDKRMLAECAAKRAMLALASGWGHEYNDDDTWYSCGLATSYYSDEPGSGCADDSKHGRCTCGLVERQRTILAPLAAVYADHPDYQQGWAA